MADATRFVVVWALLALVAGLSGFAVPAPAAAQGITLTWTGRTSDQFWNLYERWSQDYTVKPTSQPSADVTVTIGEGAVCPATGSFSVDTDLVTNGNQDTLTFTDSNWDDAQTVRITATADADTNDNTRLCQVQHSAAGGGYDSVTSPKFLFNQEFPGEVSGTFVQKTVNGLEGSKNRTYKVWLTHAPNADATVTITFKSGDTDISIDTDADTDGDQNTLTFTTSDWADPGKAVTIDTAEDGDALRGSAVFTHTATGGGYDHSIGERVVDVTIWEVDDDDPPSKPTGLSATAGDASADLSWNSSANLPNSEYWTYSKWQYRYKTTGGYGSWTDIADSGPNTTSHTVTGLTNGVLHTFQIRAHNDVTGAASDEASATPKAPLSFGSATIANYSLVQNAAITTVTLPAASGGDPAYTYTLTPAPPAGVTFTAASRQLSGTPTTLTASRTYTYTVTDSASATASFSFAIAVETDSMPSVGAVANQSFVQNSAISTVTLPAATGGNSPLAYSISPAPPAGLSFDASTRELTGTPTGTQQATTYTYTATDFDGDPTTATFTIAIAADAQPSFGTGTVADQTWTQNAALTSLTLPAATGGNTPLTYTLARTSGTPALPPGVSFDASTRTLSGTPTTLQSAVEYTYTATDADGDAVTLTFDITVETDTQPTVDSVNDQSYHQNSAITTLTLPAGSGGQRHADLLAGEELRDAHAAAGIGVRRLDAGAHGDPHGPPGIGELHLHRHGPGRRRGDGDLQHHHHPGQHPLVRRRRDDRRQGLRAERRDHHGDVAAGDGRRHAPDLLAVAGPARGPELRRLLAAALRHPDGAQVRDHLHLYGHRQRQRHGHADLQADGGGRHAAVARFGGRPELPPEQRDHDADAAGGDRRQHALHLHPGKDQRLADAAAGIDVHGLVPATLGDSDRPPDVCELHLQGDGCRRRHRDGGLQHHDHAGQHAVVRQQQHHRQGLREGFGDHHGDAPRGHRRRHPADLLAVARATHGPEFRRFVSATERHAHGAEGGDHLHLHGDGRERRHGDGGLQHHGDAGQPAVVRQRRVDRGQGLREGRGDHHGDPAAGHRRRHPAHLLAVARAPDWPLVRRFLAPALRDPDSAQVGDDLHLHGHR